MRRTLGWHLILTFYGFWLPNDPRGSGSDFVRSRHLYDAGGGGTLHLADGERSVAHRPVEPDWRRRTRGILRKSPVRLDGTQARSVARGLARAVEECGYVVWRCAILRQHAHLVLEPHPRPPRQAVGHLKARVTQRMRADGTHPFLDHAGEITNPLWARRCRVRFVTDLWWLAGALRYVGGNPEKEGLPRQNWRFETPCPLVKVSDTRRKRRG